MPAYNFKEQFAPDVESGKKRSTIRPRRKRPTRQGDILYLYTGMRTKACRRLRTKVCKSVEPITIDHGSIALNGETFAAYSLEAHELAQLDGFKNALEFIRFFHLEYGLPTEGLELIKW